MRRVRAHLSYANVMSSIAVFMVLGGSAYAAATLPKNSVGSKQIKSNAVTSSKVKNGSLLSKDFKPGQLVAGAPGPQGPQGPKGDTGTVDTSNFYDKSSSDGRFLGKSDKAADADKLDGRDSSGFLTSSGAATSSAVNINSCTGAPLVSYPVTVTRSSRILGFGSVDGFYDSNGSHQAFATVQLLSGSTVVARASRGGSPTPGNNWSINSSGVLLSDAAGSPPYDAAPGSYTLRLFGDNSGLCSGYVQYQGIRLTHVLLPN